jgi:hypothetical protein
MSATLQAVSPLAEYEGRVLYFREQNGHNDSDFSALVETTPGTYKWIEYATTRFPCPWPMSAPLNATDEVLDRYEAVQAADQESIRRDLDRYAARSANKGATVRVTGGRKHVGKEGTVFWQGLDHYKSNRNGRFYRLGIQVGNERFYVSAQHCEVSYQGEWLEVIGYRSNSAWGHESVLAMCALPNAENVRRACLAWRQKNQ